MMTEDPYRYFNGAQFKEDSDWRSFEWPLPLPDCPTCRGNPYWGKTLSSWERCKCVHEQLSP